MPAGYVNTYERIAPIYDVLDKGYEVLWKRRLRALTFAGTSGTILDAGAGAGCNMPFYPAGARVIAVDASPGMLARARVRAAKLGRDVELHVLDLADTGFPGASIDHIVATFVFCVLPEDVMLPALREMTRILKPDGTIRILDYTLSSNGATRLWMRAMTPWLRFAFAARYTADVQALLPEAGLDVAENRFVLGDSVKLLVVRPDTALRRSLEAAD
ncbi:class I SAM-dependent methyltransferase [Azospirillum sp. TSO22-1]|uniref:class I SAM-dependent methyltransferase n=1 Tax=Azospirillum sp. TSO22-1 TaxID=716789 RepID=UPI000D60A19E|nr:class I SAM-dependent methyltransferase [Azospirillum sp. TSO22-1]PWC40355.1 methyltransferase [Azospirillum sp. TSO22-1]